MKSSVIPMVRFQIARLRTFSECSPAASPKLLSLTANKPTGTASRWMQSRFLATKEAKDGALQLPAGVVSCGRGA